MTTPLRRALVLALAGCALAGAAAARDRSTALGRDGEVYRVLAGSYGQLFPGGGAAAVETPVLALEVTRPGAAAERQLVPGSEGPALDVYPFAIFEESGSALFLVWQSRGDGEVVHALTSFHAGGWEPVIEVRDNATAEKSPPELGITRDEVEIVYAPDAIDVVRRTVLHLLWWEDGLAGGQILYRPIAILDGVFGGSAPPLALDALDTGDPEPAAAAVRQELVRSPRLEPGRTGRSLVASFASPRSGRVLGVELAIVAGELARLGDDVRAHIIIGGGRFLPNVAALGADVRSFIEQRGRLHKGVLSFIGEEVRAHILVGGAIAPADLPRVGAVSRHRVVCSGGQVAANSLDRLGLAADCKTSLVELRGPGLDAVPGPSHLVQLKVAARRAAPDTEAAPTRLYASADGRAQLVAWEAAGEIRYRETRGANWSRVFTLALGPDLDQAAADEILSARIRGR